MRRTVSLSVAALAALFFAASLLLPAFRCEGSSSFLGYQVLAMGPFALLSLDPRWLANLGFAIIFVSTVIPQPTARPILVGGTALLALFAFAPATGCTGGGGAPDKSSGLALGGYLWVVSLLAVCIANIGSSAKGAPLVERAGGDA